MNEAEIFSEQLKALQATLKEAIDPGTVITGIHLENGSYHVLSRYGDTVWTLPDSLFAAGVTDGNKKLNFLLVPVMLRDTLRECMAHYIIKGVEGQRRPRGVTISKFFYTVNSFLNWLDEQGIVSLSDVTQLIAQQYVEFCKGLKGQKGGSLSCGSKRVRFQAVETLQILSQQCDDPMPPPWPESSANHLAGLTGQAHPRYQEAKTKIIPDEILGPLFQSAVGWLERADEIISLRVQVKTWEAEGCSRGSIISRLKVMGWNLSAIRTAVQHLQSACICIILITSGIRVSELCSLENQCAFKTLDDEGDSFYWIRGNSYKAGEGICEWLVAEITHQAIAVAERLASPLQAQLEQCRSDLRTSDPQNLEITRLSCHAQRLFLTVTQNQHNRLGTLSNLNVISRLNAFASQCGLDWHFTPHQFRRTFAVYAAHSVFGDLRYLRDHFKHWSLDMTILYAMSREQDADLYDEMSIAVLNIKTDLLEHWLEPDAILTGGAAEQIQTFRTKNEALATKQDRAEMARTISPLVHIRATGVAWCTADTGGCNGGQGVEKTRCADCGNAVIDESRKPVWQRIYAQQIELRALADIGPGGSERIARDIEHCKAVLKGLGATEEDFSDVAT
ncbi:hypothetical protein [Methylophaga sp.]|uniref:hypothetical protein n=1 Tax=Methylophaga sp. TaxID=2024840 RepID=UPI003F7204A9